MTARRKTAGRIGLQHGRNLRYGPTTNETSRRGPQPTRHAWEYQGGDEVALAVAARSAPTAEGVACTGACCCTGNRAGGLGTQDEKFCTV